VVADPVRVPFEPCLSLDLLRRTARRQLPGALRGPGVEWLFCGTAAVHRAIRALGIASPDRVLMPDYNCGIELDAVRAAGADVAYYRTTAEGLLDLADLDAQARPPVRAIYVIHYFGFPQPLQPVLALARLRGLYVVEDCAHALYSEVNGQPLGSLGDAAVFSPRKTLPLMDGGALLRGPAGGRAPLSAPPWRHTLREFLDSLGRHWARQPGAPARAVARALRRAAELLLSRHAPEKPLSRLASEDFASVRTRLNCRMSSASRRLLLRIDHADVVARRRRNYLRLVQSLPAGGPLRPLYVGLPDGVCPLYLPLLAQERDRASELMESCGVETFRYWTWRHPELPAGASAEFLRDHLLALPVHQDMGEPELRAVEVALSVCAERL
jgi:hypothetical protein